MLRIRFGDRKQIKEILLTFSIPNKIRYFPKAVILSAPCFKKKQHSCCNSYSRILTLSQISIDTNVPCA